MKKPILILVILMVAFTINTTAQAPAGDVNKQKLSIFNAWAGEWEGEGSSQMGPGAAKKSKVHEKIEFKLDNTVLMVEGIGRSMDPKENEAVVHHALAVLSYDIATQTYKFKSYLKDGRTTDAWFNVVEENKYAWGFDIPNGKIRYQITIDPQKKTWNEVGEFSQDGTQWFKFFNMDLVKK
jgi:hypothetical protein